MGSAEPPLKHVQVHFGGKAVDDVSISILAGTDLKEL